MIWIPPRLFASLVLLARKIASPASNHPSRSSNINNAAQNNIIVILSLIFVLEICCKVKLRGPISNYQTAIIKYMCMCGVKHPNFREGPRVGWQGVSRIVGFLQSPNPLVKFYNFLHSQCNIQRDMAGLSVGYILVVYTIQGNIFRHTAIARIYCYPDNCLMHANERSSYCDKVTNKAQQALPGNP